jgi:hypothetical protein
MRKDTWHKSSASASATNCVEIKPTDNNILVRDSKDHGNNTVLRFTDAGWRTFIGNAADGSFES